MVFFKAGKSKDEVSQGGGNHIVTSGCYPVTVLVPIVSISKNGSTSIDPYVDHKGQKQIIYGNLRITNNDGSTNKIGSKIFNQLVIIAGLDDVANPVTQSLPIGKKEAAKDVDILEDIQDVDVYMRVQMEYNIYKGNIQEKKVIKAFFRAEDKATAEEIVNGTEPGVGYDREMKYNDNVTYKDNLDEETIKAWISKGRPEGTGGSAEAKPKPSFGDKRAPSDKSGKFGESKTDD